MDKNTLFKTKYFQAFSVFFICIALTSDMICFLFIPVHWLFFAASTYVWVQYVWHTGTGYSGTAQKLATQRNIEDFLLRAVMLCKCSHPSPCQVEHRSAIRPSAINDTIQ